MKSIGYDLYYGITNAKGETRIGHARVWDGNRMNSQATAALSLASCGMTGYTDF